MKLNEVCATFLREAGVQRVYGIPGTQTLDLMEALGQAGVQYVLTHHETAAGYMAAAEGQLTGVPGVCLVTQGPGATNAATAIANARLDRSPLVVLASTRSKEPGMEVTHQILPLEEMYAPLAKQSMELTARNVRRSMAAAFALATASRPGPVFLTLSISEGRKEASESFVPVQPPLMAAGEGVDGSAALALAAARLGDSRRPAIVAGTGCMEARASLQLRELAERLGAPVAVSMRAKGEFPEDHPLFVGTFGGRADRALHDLLDSADLVLLVGLDGVEFSKPRPFKSFTVSLAPLGADDPVYRPNLAIDGDLAAHLETLAAEARGETDWEEGEPAACRERIARALQPKGKGGLAPQTVVRLLREEMPRDTIAACDIGAHKGLVCQGWSSYRPGEFLVATGLSSMGFGLSAAVAAKTVRPDRPVLCVTGDGGLLMYCGELRTLARMGLAATVVVMADGGLTSISVKQRERGYAPIGVEFGRPDYLSVARGFGLEGARVEDADSCRLALREAVRSEGPFLIQADVNPGGYR